MAGEVRQPLDWLGSAERVAAISQEAGLPVAGVCGQGWNFVNDPVVFEINCRRIEFAAAVGADAFVIMAPDRPGDRPPSAEEINRFAASAEELRKVGARPGHDGRLSLSYGAVGPYRAGDSAGPGRGPRSQSCASTCRTRSSSGGTRTTACESSATGWPTCTCRTTAPGATSTSGRATSFPAFRAIFDTLDEIQFDGWVVCHGGHLTDDPPRERARISREYLRGIGR